MPRAGQGAEKPSLLPGPDALALQPGGDFPVPPPEVLMGRDSVVSEWKFELLRTVGGPAGGGVGINCFRAFATLGLAAHS